MGETEHKAEVTTKCEAAAYGAVDHKGGLPSSVWEQGAVKKVIQARVNTPAPELLELNS